MLGIYGLITSGVGGKVAGAAMSVGKRVVFYLIVLSIPILAPIVAVTGYYGYKKVSAPATNEGSYGQIDGELGWVLKPGSRSRYYMTDRVTGTAYFDSTVYTNSAGFRAPSLDAEFASGSMVAIGDSWTFGYAVDYEQSYPAQLEKLLGRDVVNMGVPAYGSAQVLLLLERHLGNCVRPMWFTSISVCGTGRYAMAIHGRGTY